MAEVGGDHEKILLLVEILSKLLTIFLFSRLAEIADHYRHQSDALFSKDFLYVRNVHFHAVLSLIDFSVHECEVSTFVQLLNRFPVDLQISQRGLIHRCIAQGTVV